MKYLALPLSLGAAMAAGLLVFAAVVWAWTAATGAKLGLAGFIARGSNPSPTKVGEVA